MLAVENFASQDRPHSENLALNLTLSDSLFLLWNKFYISNFQLQVVFFPPHMNCSFF